MKILAGKYGTKREYASIEQYAEAKLDGADYDGGIIEATAATAQNVSEALGRLLDFLADKGMITAADVGYIVEGNHYVHLTFGD